jgi:hypothetical protein
MRDRTRTGGIEIAAEPAAVARFLADARNLPRWAPGFADEVEGSPESGWQITKEGRRFAIRVAVNEECGTVDYIREIAPGREGGACLRAIARIGGGSVLVMTLPVLPGIDPADTAEILRIELETVRDLLQ